MALNERNQNKLLDIGLKVGLVGLAGVGLFLANKVYKNWMASGQGAQAGSDPNTQAATLLYAAMYQSGVSILSWADGTDEESLYNTASVITDFAKVSAAYKNLYGRILADDLTNELGADELQAFYLALRKPNLAAAYAADYAKKYGFKYRVGDKLKSNPIAGTAKIAYMSVSKKNGVTTLSIKRWNQIPQSLVGTVVGYRYQKVVDNDKTVKMLRMYLVKSIPDLSADTSYYVFERDVLIASR